jgi:hypothetical protein
MEDVSFAAPCGLCCSDCHFFGTECRGCSQVQGRPFWSVHVPGGACPIHSCCVGERHLEHCGTCASFPCRTFHDLRDPNMSDEAFRESLIKREETLRRRAQIGTEAWFREKV